jgi:hypothetical protein
VSEHEEYYVRSLNVSSIADPSIKSEHMRLLDRFFARRLYQSASELQRSIHEKGVDELIRCGQYSRLLFRFDWSDVPALIPIRHPYWFDLALDFLIEVEKVLTDMESVGTKKKENFYDLLDMTDDSINNLMRDVGKSIYPLTDRLEILYLQITALQRSSCRSHVQGDPNSDIHVGPEPDYLETVFKVYYEASEGYSTSKSLSEDRVHRQISCLH